MLKQRILYYKVLIRRESILQVTVIPLAKAIQLCKKYRAIHTSNFPIQCWNCLEASKEVTSKMYFYNPPTHDGCEIVNKLYKMYLDNRSAICSC